MTECHVQPFRNILGTECSDVPVFPPGGAAEPTGAPGLEPVSLPSDLVELPFEVPRFLLEPRGWPTTTSLGMEVVSPSTQHIPTTVIPYEPSSATPGWLSGVSAVWPWGLSAVWPSGISAVWPSGLSPRGAASFVHARLGAKGYQGRMVVNLPSPCPPTCHRCPEGDLGGLAAAVYPTGLCLSPCLLSLGAFPAFEPRRQGGRECAVRSRIQQSRGGTDSDRKRFRPPTLTTHEKPGAPQAPLY